MSFNSATARMAVETERRVNRRRGCGELQFGHGADGRGDFPRLAASGSGSSLQFGHGADGRGDWTAPRPATRATRLQFGHGADGRGDFREVARVKLAGVASI